VKPQSVGGTAGPEALTLLGVRRFRAHVVHTAHADFPTTGRKQKVGGAMITAANFREKVVRTMGTIMMIMWMLVLGPVGALLLGGLAYAMFAKSLVAGAFCAMLIFLPLVLTLAWGTLGLIATLRVNRAQQSALLLTPKPIHSSTWSAEM
jgi:hypothetical protein